MLEQMTKSLSYVFFEVVCEGTSFLEQKPSKEKPNNGGWHDWGSILVSPPSSLDQIRKSEVKPGNDIKNGGGNVLSDEFCNESCILPKICGNISYSWEPCYYQGWGGICPCIWDYLRNCSWGVSWYCCVWWIQHFVRKVYQQGSYFNSHWST